MTTNELLILNFEEIRRRSLKVFSGIPQSHYNWKPDKDAMTMLEMVRHIFESEAWFQAIIINRGSVNFDNPWENLPYTNIEDEIEFASSYRANFIAMIKNTPSADFENVEIIRADLNQRRKLGDYLLRTAYHESVHTGQLLNYMRSAGLARPKVWD